MARAVTAGLGTLRGFEAAARLGSFADAAAALHLTQSAISHQVRTLEADLGQPLFRRVGRSVVLTDAGKDFAQTVSRVLRMLDDGVARLSPYRKPRSVILYTTSAVARGFVLPNMPEFRARHPDVDLWLDTSEREIDFTYDEVDLLISSAPRAASPHVLVTPLVGDAQRPMASPALIAARGGAPAGAAALKRWPLLHDEGAATWREWFERAGVSADDSDAGPSFSDHACALEAAAAGQGVVLGSTLAARHLLATGALVYVDACALERPAFQLYCDSRQLGDEAVCALREWLIDLASRETDVP